MLFRPVFPSVFSIRPPRLTPIRAQFYQSDRSDHNHHRSVYERISAMENAVRRGFSKSLRG